MQRAEKVEALRSLARKRASTQYAGYNGIGDYLNGAYECDHVSPYTKSAGNVDSQIMLVLRDWSSDKYLKKSQKKCHQQEVVKLGYDPALPTNKNLIPLLRDHFNLELKDVYATNLFPFIKPGDISSRIPEKMLERAGTEFLLPQIRIVKPRLIVALGFDTFNAIRRSNNLRPVQPMDTAMAQPFNIDEALVRCQSHPNTRGRNNRGGADKVSEDWQSMADAFKREVDGLTT